MRERPTWKETMAVFQVAPTNTARQHTGAYHRRLAAHAKVPRFELFLTGRSSFLDGWTLNKAFDRNMLAGVIVVDNRFYAIWGKGPITPDVMW